MTLLEMLVAVTLLGALTTLTATMWSQVARWSEENHELDAPLRVRRALETLDRQWRSRVETAPVDERDPWGMWIDGRVLEFITEEPLLEPEWPLVRARWSIEGERSANVAERDRLRLVYEERRLPGPGGIDGNEPVRPGDVREMVVMEECAALAWQAPGGWARATPGVVDVGLWRTIEPPPAGLSRDAVRRLWGLQIAERDEAPQGLANIETAGDQAGGDAPEREGDAGGGPSAQGPPRAVRLTGTIRGEEFAWALIVQPSR